MKRGHSRFSWQDLYYDGDIDERFEFFDEDMQEIIIIQTEDRYAAGGNYVGQTISFFKIRL
ncbi:hypothetical protein MKX50_15210 [Paenibacillus sp. FSL W8-0186]|uniref:Uncharacterized protein n=1 Tax=Paenibacillus woosongensis TaxID=307580 RepID=A0ABQ4MQ48_9BACL|nr:hypothetical protein [Paenibacillus woosongensis]GIP58141.1 hypothetical protein J15TS10_19550 [Paenibacillus woosongensis]